MQTLRGHSSGFDLIAFSPDGKLLASASLDSTIRGWDATTGKLLYTIEAPTNGFTAEHYLAFIDHSRFLLITDINLNNRIIDAATGKEILKLRPDLPPGVIKVSSDSSTLATSSDNGYGATLWDLKALRAGQTFEPLFSVGGHKGFVLAIAYSPDGTRLATGSQDGVIKVWAVTPEGGQELMTLNGHKTNIADLRFSPDGSSLASASEDGSVKVWDVTPEGSRELLTLAKHEGSVRGVAFSPVDDRLATASYDGKVRIWDGQTGRLLHTLAGHEGKVYSVAFHPDGSQLASSGEDFTVRVWDVDSGQELLTLVGHEDSQGEAGDYKSGGLHAGVAAVAYGPDGKFLASTGEDGTARIWNARSGALLKTLHIHPDRNGGINLAFSLDGTRLATATDQTGPTKAGEDQTLVSIWEVETWQSLITLTGFPSRVWGLAFSPDGKQLATSSMFVDLWDANTGQKLFSLPDAGSVATAYSPDGSRLVTAGAGLPKIWDLASRQVLFTIPGHTGFVGGAAFNPDGTRLATASRDGTARVYTMDIDELMAIAEDRLTRWFTPEECRQFLHQETCPPR